MHVRLFAVFFPQLAPIAKKLGGSIFDKSVVKFFTNIVDQAMKERKNGNTVRHMVTWEMWQ